MLSMTTANYYLRFLAEEIATLRKEALAFKAVRTALRTAASSASSGAAKMVFEKVRVTPS